MSDLQLQSSDHSATAAPNVHAVSAERSLQWLVSGWRLFLKAPGVWVGMTVVLLVAFVLLLALLPLLLGLLVLIPVLIGSVYASYFDIYGASPGS